MSSPWIGWAAACLVLSSGCAGLAGCDAESEDAQSEAGQEEAGREPVASVEVVSLKREEIEETLTAFGTVEAAQGDLQTLSVPYECRVRRILVLAGQEVEVGQELIEIEPSPDSLLRIRQARQERQTASRQLELVRQRLDMRLATRQDLSQAEQTLAATELNVASLVGRGSAGAHTLRAVSAGLVSRIDVQSGQLVSAGAALVETIGQDQLVVRFGIESADHDRIHPGQAVRIELVNVPKAACAGEVSSIAREVDPKSRLVSAFVVTRGCHLLLNAYARGRFVLAARQGLVVAPRAVLPEADGRVLYTVEKGRAVRHSVEIGLKGKDRIEVIGSDLTPGQLVVVTGNSELQDKMAVKVETPR